MKLRNKKTGEIIEFKPVKFNDKVDDGIVINVDDWEIYVEPKEFWYIDCDGEVYSTDRLSGYDLNKLKEIGDCFETREEAEKAVEKLEAWKRLKDAGFWFKSDSIKNDNKYEYILRLQCEEDKRFKTFKENEDLFNDLKLLFRGEK